MSRELNVSAIENGTVIDHIDNHATFQVADILRVSDEHSKVLIGVNLPSKHIGKKGIIKIENRSLSDKEVNKIAVIAPDATVNIIKNYQVVKKFRVHLPERIEQFIKCFNPRCVTNNENVKSLFDVVEQSPLRLRCVYCERIMEKKDIELEV